MRKKELLKLAVLTVTPAIRDKVREDIGEQRDYVYGSMSWKKEKKTVTLYSRYRYYRAAVENDILKIAIFTRVNVAAGLNYPVFTIFIDKKEEQWISYNHAEEKWSDAMIFNLDIREEPGEKFGSNGWESVGDVRTVNEYIGIEGSIRKSVRRFQDEIRTREREKAHQSELDQIDEIMELVPELPKDFGEWITTSGLKDAAYMIMYAGTNDYFCTHCQKMVSVRGKNRHNETGKCPSCHALVEYKYAKKQKVLDSSKNVTILQPLADNSGYVVRMFHVRAKMKQSEGYHMEMRYWETNRFRLDHVFCEQERFEYGEYKHTGVRRWIHEQRKGMYYAAYYQSEYGCLYDRNLDKILEKTPAKYVPLRQFLRRNTFPHYDADVLMKALVRYPDLIEKLMKVRLDNLVNTVIDAIPDEINPEGKNLEQILRLSKEGVRLARECDATKKELMVIQIAEREKIRIDEDTVHRLAYVYKYYGNDDMTFIMRRGKLQKMLNYFDRLVQESTNDIYTVARDYEDYIRQLQMLNMPIKENRFPSGFYTVHNQLSDQIVEMQDKIKQKQTAKDDRRLRKLVREDQKKYFTSSKDYVIVWPKSRKDFVYEAQIQHNCVATNYYQLAVNGSTTIFFLRKKEDIRTPFCTVEFKDGKMIQCRTIYNGQAPEEAMNVMKEIEKNYAKVMKLMEKEQKESCVAVECAV